MMPNGPNGGNVSYTTKELLSRIDEKIDRLDEKLDQKAEKAEVDALYSTIEILKETAVKRDGPLMREYWEYTHDSRNRIETLEREVLSRAKYIPVLEETNRLARSLDARYWRIAGGVSVIAVIAAANAVRIWVGL